MPRSGSPGALVEATYESSAAGIGIAAAVVVATTIAAAAGTTHAVIAAAAPNDDQQDDDPAAISPTKTVIAHIRTSYEDVDH